MGKDNRITDSAGNEALVTAAGNRLQTRVDFESTADLDILETSLDAIETLLQGTAKVKIWDGTDTLGILGHDTAYNAADRGIFILGSRSASGNWEMFPVARYNDAVASKAFRIVPVTPMTGLRREGTIVHSADINFSIAFEVQNIGAKTGYVLIDLSDATNYPHANTGKIHVDWLSIKIHGTNTAEGHIHIGFISAIDADHATIHTIAGLPIAKLEDVTEIVRNHHPSAIVCTTDNHLAGGSALMTDDAVFQNDETVIGTYGTPIPAVGDLVMIVDWTAGTFENVVVSIGYHTET